MPARTCSGFCYHCRAWGRGVENPQSKLFWHFAEEMLSSIPIVFSIPPKSIILEASSRQSGNLQDCQTGREKSGGGTPWKSFVKEDKEGTLALPCFMKRGTHATKLDYKNLILQALRKPCRPGEALPCWLAMPCASWAKTWFHSQGQVRENQEGLCAQHLTLNISSWKFTMHIIYIFNTSDNLLLPSEQGFQLCHLN